MSDDRWIDPGNDDIVPDLSWITFSRGFQGQSWKRLRDSVLGRRFHGVTDTTEGK